jgi:outer membrane protein assembly factor BamB
MRVAYSQPLVARSRAVGEPYERGQPEIDAAGRRVFVGSSDRGLYALSAEDGSVLWRFETVGFVQSAPLYVQKDNAVYFGSNDGALYKVNASTGALRWRFMSNAEISRRPVLAYDTLYVVNANDTVLALDPTTGERRWSQHRTPAAGMEVAGHAGPLVFRGNVYTGFSDGTVAAFDARTGVERWQPVDLSAEAEQLLGQLPQYLDVDTTPVADEIEAGPVIYVGSYVGGVYALEADTGTQVWSNPDVGGVADLVLWSEPERLPRSGEGPLVPARKLLIASTGTTGLWALDPETGAEVWRRRVPRGGVSAPVPVTGALLVSATALGVFLVSPLDGGLIDGIHLEDGVSMTPAAYGRRAFVLTNTGSFLSLLVPSPLGADPSRRLPL